jgi:hypothetical protein
MASTEVTNVETYEKCNMLVPRFHTAPTLTQWPTLLLFGYDMKGECKG